MSAMQSCKMLPGLGDGLVVRHACYGARRSVRRPRMPATLDSGTYMPGRQIRFCGAWAPSGIRSSLTSYLGPMP